MFFLLTRDSLVLIRSAPSRSTEMRAADGGVPSRDELPHGVTRPSATVLLKLAASKLRTSATRWSVSGVSS